MRYISKGKKLQLSFKKKKTRLDNFVGNKLLKNRYPLKILPCYSVK